MSVHNPSSTGSRTLTETAPLPPPTVHTYWSETRKSTLPSVTYLEKERKAHFVSENALSLEVSDQKKMAKTSEQT